ncbi:MAG: hypothetical protein WC401_12425 [Bacteroidales bacterium]|jgi:hypothetical protein|nr:hypothetical protein [Bacteroidales bacterium]
MKKISYSIILLVGFLSGLNVCAQVHFNIYTEAGKNNVSEGFYMKTAAIGTIWLAKNRIELGGQFDVISPNNNRSQALLVNYTREFPLKKLSLEPQCFFMYNHFSEVLFETNWGVTLGAGFRHFYLKLGTNFRTYGIPKNAIKKYDITNHENIHENFNIMYSASYFVKLPEHKWNIGITLTNIDNFLINQETNPVFYLHGKYQINQLFTIYSEAWYKSAGAFNLSVNPFGFFIRTGFIWSIKY